MALGMIKMTQELPPAQPAHHQTTPLWTYSAPQGSQPAKLLVVDDENGPRQALRMLLKEEFNVELANGVDAALEVLNHEAVDVIITDIRMPNKSGLDLLREVKKRYPDIQVIILTGFGQLESAMEAIECGAFAYLEKPFDSNVMMEKVHASVERRREEQSRRAMEYLAVEANRFETLGHMVSGALHDLGTPLSVIGTNLDLLLDQPNKPDIERRLEVMRGQVKHCTDLVRTTLNFLRRSPEVQLEISLNQVVEQCLEVARPFLISHQVASFSDLCPSLPPIMGDIVMVRQAVLNLVYNAAQAMQQQEDSRVISVRTWSEEGFACLAVEDTGPGIAKEIRDHIFDTLFTTKGKQGTGLGLSVVKYVMQRHGGEVRVEDAPDQGTRFLLRFPLTKEN